MAVSDSIQQGFMRLAAPPSGRCLGGVSSPPPPPPGSPGNVNIVRICVKASPVEGAFTQTWLMPTFGVSAGAGDVQLEGPLKVQRWGWVGGRVLGLGSGFRVQGAGAQFSGFGCSGLWANKRWGPNIKNTFVESRARMGGLV